MSLCGAVTELRRRDGEQLDANCSNHVLRDLNYLNFLHEPCIRASPLTADCFGQRARTAGRTTTTNFLLLLQPQHAAVSITHSPLQHALRRASAAFLQRSKNWSSRMQNAKARLILGIYIYSHLPFNLLVSYRRRYEQRRAGFKNPGFYTNSLREQRWQPWREKAF